MDFTPPSRYLQEAKAIMDYLVPDYLNRIPAEKLSDFAAICANIQNLHWQMDAVEKARAEQKKAEEAVVGGENKLLNLRRKLTQEDQDQKHDFGGFRPNDDLPF